jgi:trehalose/maltose hydrolase-like predicted phosphorylase
LSRHPLSIRLNWRSNGTQSEPDSRGDFPAEEWNVIEKGFHPEFLAQLETTLALGNGYLGVRGCPEEGGPNTENATLI